MFLRYLTLFLVVIAIAQCKPADEETTEEEVPALDDRQTLDELLEDVFVKDAAPGSGGVIGGTAPVTSRPVAVTQKPIVTQRPAPLPPAPAPSKPITGGTVTGGSVTISNAPNPCSEGECVQFYQCANGSVITDGEGLIDVRFREDDNDNPNKVDHPCPNLLLTCCTIRSETPIIPDIPIATGCGYRNAEGVGFRITGDKENEAQFGEFPWHVAVLKIEKSLGRTLSIYQCGGSIIAPNVILTGAHCVYGKDPSQIKIRAGEWDTQSEDEIFPHQDRLVSEFIIHEDYNSKNLHNDVALLILKEPVDITENVNTVCLPGPHEVFDYKRCFVSGWGKDLFGKEGVYQVILKRVELPVVPHDECQVKLRTTRLGNHFNLDDSFTCAGGERGRDTCKGDGGSPLVCPIAGTVNRYVQAGIVAWGIGCNDPIPGVYVNVPLFREWIDSKIDGMNVHKTSYIA